MTLTVTAAFDRVLVARHGETEWNRVGRRQGQLDSPLTDSGHEQASLIVSTVALAPIDAIFSSPLGRARTTARVIAVALCRELVVVDELAEVHHGAFAGLTNAEIEERFPGELDRRSRDKYRWRFPNGESYKQAGQRAAVALQRIEVAGSRKPLLITHEMITRMLLKVLLQLEPDAALALSLPYGVVMAVSPATRMLEQLQPPEPPHTSV